MTELTEIQIWPKLSPNQFTIATQWKWKIINLFRQPSRPNSEMSRIESDLWLEFICFESNIRSFFIHVMPKMRDWSNQSKFDLRPQTVELESFETFICKSAKSQIN